MTARNPHGPGGGRAVKVTQSGLARVRAGEIVVSASTSAAEAEQIGADDRTVVNYHFPVEIEVRAGGASIDAQKIADLALARLAESLEEVV